MQPRRIVDYPSLSGYLRDLYQVRGVAPTVNFDQHQAPLLSDARRDQPDLHRADRSAAESFRTTLPRGGADRLRSVADGWPITRAYRALREPDRVRARTRRRLWFDDPDGYHREVAAPEHGVRVVCVEGG